MPPGVVVCWSGFEPRVQAIRIPPEGLILGRAFASPTDDQISRQHARVRIVEGALEIEDLQSRNGTFINKWLNTKPMRVPFPAIIRAGRTVFAVLAEISSYEDLHEEGRIGVALERGCKAVEEAARAEQNVTIEAGGRIAMTLVRRYCDTFGGNEVIYQPHIDKPSLDESLAGTRPRVVVLALTDSALSFPDMPTVMTWLETDVRFVTVMWPRSNALSMVDPTVVARLRECVIEVPNPRYDELPYRVRDIAREHAPDIPLDASVCEGMLLKSIELDEEWVVPRFAKAVATWYADARFDHTLLRMRDIIGDIEPPPSGAYCLDGGMQRRRRSF